MTRISRIATILLAGAALPMLAGCGASDIASPGDSPNAPINVVIGGGGSGGGSGTSVAASACPNITGADKLTDGGVIGDGANTWRNCQLPARFNSTTTLPNLAGVLYSMNGRVNVGTDKTGLSTDYGVTLNIEPGVVVFAKQGQASFLAVNRGNKIHAVGTAAKPIVFTSQSNVQGLATDDTSAEWGGIVLLGRATITDCDVAGQVPRDPARLCERDTEGTTGALFGGNNDNDSSGELQYVQIRYSGYTLELGKELQGLTPSGVGKGTTIDHIQVHNSSDDGIEVFGGTFNMKNLVFTGNEDDNLDTDVGYRGAVQYVISVQRYRGNSNQGDTFLETDSNPGTAANRSADILPRQSLKVANFTHVQRFNGGENLAVMMLRGGADLTLVNGVVAQSIVTSNSVTLPGAGGVAGGGAAITGASLLPCLEVRDAATLRDANVAVEDLGKPVYKSVVMQCLASQPFTSGARVGVNPATSATFTADDIKAIFLAGATTNSFAFTPNLTGFFINGATETAVVATDPKTVDAFFDTTNYVGAVKDASDTWYTGWTCNSQTATLGVTNGRCTAIPALGA